MRLANSQMLLDLQKKPENIRNICIMAHVDHGKTTLADSLVASNGIISARMAGKLRYMDSRKDEQERGITMKSSCIALHFNKDNTDYLINLIDSPGHVDFSSEVSTAVRLCDGAIVLVDAIEGVCPQTQVALRQVWLENIKPVLVINKIDRLILEMKMSPLDAYVHIVQLLEQLNAIMGDLFKSDVLRKGDECEAKQLTVDSSSNTDVTYNWSAGLEDVDDSHIYFSPELGNVVFASAFDGWGFRVQDFARLYSEKLGINAHTLQQTLWGDYYLNSKTKRIMRGAQEKAKKPLFVQLVLDNIWAVYDTVMIRKEKEKLLKIVESLNIKMTSRDLRHTDARVQIQALCSQWLPLSTAVLDMVCEKLPSPKDLSEEKVEHLMCSTMQSIESLPPETRSLKEAFLKCSSDPDAPIIVFISKMFPVERKILPQNRPKALTSEEIALRREQARIRHAALVEQANTEKSENTCTTDNSNRSHNVSELIPAPTEDDDAFIAFARVYSGVLRRGQKVYVLGPKHDPSTAIDMLKQGHEINPEMTLKDLKIGFHITVTEISDLYLLMGRELELLEEVPAGNVVGIGGLEEHVLKSATLSSDIACPPFSELQLMAVPILRVAIEPARPTDIPALVRGLKLLNQADACVQVIIQESGEHVLVTAGEVHLERCLDDLQERYAKVPLNVSEPIVPFKETIVPPPTTDMVNEAIQNQNIPVKKESSSSNINKNQGLIIASTPSKQSTVNIRAVPLPNEVTRILDKNSELIKTLHHVTDKNDKNKKSDDVMSDNLDLSVSQLKLNDEPITHKTVVIADKTVKAVQLFQNELQEAFKQAPGDEFEEKSVEQIWSFGPRHCGPNILINRIKDHTGVSIWSSIQDKECSVKSSLLEYDNSFVNGFQLATLAGPLCEEPLMGVAFIVEDWVVDTQVESSQSSAPYGPLSGQIMSVVKDACRKAFQAQPQRLMAAMYSCSIQVNAEVLGKLYALLGKRQGRVLHGDMSQGSAATFSVQAVLPVIESFNFASELRKQTSGLASPQLLFSHWEVIELDPFWEPSTEEEYLHFGEKADNENRARKYMNAVRRRKGLHVDEKIVQFAEKQRTLSKNK
ncbi:elongation factor-like GTPase 1 [Lycorma delicatula]|uniref:elongation factor-like GTPase 1 n=1 Tax=Lycorma delicatula TaxID=130591 RepID=UPI003F5135FA